MSDEYPVEPAKGSQWKPGFPCVSAAGAQHSMEFPQSFHWSDVQE